jgi:methionyl-tRNA synthetase
MRWFLSSKASTGNADVKIKPVPYRDQELRGKVQKVDNVTEGIPQQQIDNNNIVNAFKDKLQGQELLEEFRTMTEKKASIIEARRARKAIEEDMDVVREICETVSDSIVGCC